MAPPPPPLLPEEQQAFHAEYKKYYEMKRGNFFQSLKVFAGVWDCLQLLCDIWQREMGDLQALTDQNHLLPKMLFTAAHARYLTAIELSFSCCIGDAYSVLRDGIESISHAYKIAHEPAQIPVWTNKHQSEADEEAYDKVFTHSKKKNLYPDKDGMNHLHTYYAHFCEMATHSSVTSLGKNFKDASTPGNVKWEYHYFETDANKLAVFLFTLSQVSAHMEGAFFASFESRLKLDPTLVDMRHNFASDIDAQRKYLRPLTSFRSLDSQMPQPTAKEIVAALDKLEAFLNDSKYIPATYFHRSKVLLALLSKALTTAKAVCTLVETGFNGEAFGLSRTLIEIYLTIRYITNKDTEARAKEYVEYVAKTQEYLMDVAAKHFPQIVLPPIDDEFKEMAKKYRSPHSWFQAHGGHVRALATEPDAHEVDAQGNPIMQDFDYEHVYSQTSHFVHATIISLMGHGVEAGETFRVRANIAQEHDRGETALFNVVIFLSKSFVSALRGLREEQPEVLNELFAMSSSFAKAADDERQASARGSGVLPTPE